MTQQDLARAVEMPQPSIARIERGVVVPRTTTLIALLDATGHQLAFEPADHVDPAVGPEAIRERISMRVPKRVHEALGRAARRDPQASPTWILRVLNRHAVPFVLIGELAEAAHGSPSKVRRIVEVCHATTDVARERLARAVEELGATPSGGRELRTDAGRLRLVTETAAGDAYEVLMRTAERMYVVPGISLRVAALEDLIRNRRAGRSPEDRRAAAVLRAVARFLG